MKLKDKNLRFIDAVEYLRREKAMTYKDVYTEMGLTRGQWDGIKRHLSNVPKECIKKIQDVYPETVQFFKSDYVRGVSGDPLNIGYKDKYIQTLEENVELYKSMLTAEEATAEYLKTLQEIKELLDELKKRPDPPHTQKP